MAAVIITDGYSSLGIEEVREKARSLKNVGVEVFAVGLGPSPDTEQIAAMASRPTAVHASQLSTRADVLRIVDTVARAICDQRTNGHHV